MTESKHTPGPWRYFEQTHWGAFGTTYGCVRSPAGVDGYDDGFVIVNGCAPGGTETQKANARLIAAAPELLEACRVVLARLDLEAEERKARGMNDNFVCSAYRETLRAAIAKAGGQ